MFVEFYFSCSHIPFIWVFNRLDLFLLAPVDDQTAAIPDSLCRAVGLVYLVPNHVETVDRHLPFRLTPVALVWHCSFLILQIRLMSYSEELDK